MADIASVSRNNLDQRRKKLRHQRKVKALQRIWQTVAVSGLAGGLLWVAIQPMWVLRQSADVVVNGNSLIATQTIQSKLPLSYPLSLWRVEPAEIRQALLSQPAIASVIVNRRLFPPGLVVRVEERVPVAVAQKITGVDNQPQTIGFVDADGVSIPVDAYSQSSNLPKLRVLGNPELYGDYWHLVYDAIRQSLVPVQEVNFQDPANVILNTDLGKVHLGIVDGDIAEAIRKLGEMRNIYQKDKVRREQVEYINLRNPETPLLQMKRPSSKPTTKTE